ncbi:MAG TPA: RNA-binding protein [Candidatus Binatia bacterium]
MGRKLYVGNLPFSVDSSALERIFADFGTVESATVVSDRESGRSRGFGFVEMSSFEEAEAAINALNGQQHGGRPLTVNEAKPRDDRPRGMGGGGGFGGRGGAGAGRGRSAGGFGGGRGTRF